MNLEAKDIIPVVLGVPVGVITYVVTNYILEPIKEYRDLKIRILADLTYYDDVAEITNTPEPERDKQLERNLKFHKHSAEMKAVFHKLPRFHKVHNWETDEFPLKSADALMKYANSRTRVHIEEAKTEIKQCLLLP